MQTPFVTAEEAERNLKIWRTLREGPPQSHPDWHYFVQSRQLAGQDKEELCLFHEDKNNPKDTRVCLGSLAGWLCGPDAPRAEARLRLANAVAKVSAERGWRACGESLCVHFFHGPCVPLATDGLDVIVHCWSGETLRVKRANLNGPVGKWSASLEEWDYIRQKPNMRFASSLSEDSLEYKIGTAFLSYCGIAVEEKAGKTRIIQQSEQASYEDWMEALSNIEKTHNEPKPKAPRTKRDLSWALEALGVSL